MQKPIKKEVTQNPFKIPAKAFNLSYLARIFNDSAAIWLNQEINGKITVAINPKKLTAGDLIKISVAIKPSYMTIKTANSGKSKDYFIGCVPFSSWLHRFYQHLHIKTKWINGVRIITLKKIRRPSIFF